MSVRRRPAIEGGHPIRDSVLPYGRQHVTEDDAAAVRSVLRGDWLTTGPAVDAFEDALRKAVGAEHAVAVSSGTAALHLACATLDLQANDEVIVPSLTFVASANAVTYCGGRPVFAEIDAFSLCLDPTDVERRIGPRTRAIMVVHYAGQPADLTRLRALARSRELVLIEDAAHALGASAAGRPIGADSDLTTFSFHPVKHITTAEGGAIVTTSAERAARMRRLRNHGLDSDVRAREGRHTWRYEMVELGYNYRLPDIAAALGTSQLARLPDILARRRVIARRYSEAFAELEGIRCQRVSRPDEHAWHLWVGLLDLDLLKVDRDRFVSALRAENIAANVHYAPVHLQPYYRTRFGTAPGDLPRTEDLSRRIFTLPLFPGMTDADQEDVVEAVGDLLRWYRR